MELQAADVRPNVIFYLSECGDVLEALKRLEIVLFGPYHLLRGGFAAELALFEHKFIFHCFRDLADIGFV